MRPPDRLRPLLLALLLLTAPASALAADQDGDGVDDREDNCAGVANPDQRDVDEDGFGNRCDPDFDNDDAVNFRDLAILKQRFFSHDAEADLDGDGVVNFRDLALLKARFFKAPGPGAPVAPVEGIFSIHQDPTAAAGPSGFPLLSSIVVGEKGIEIPGFCSLVPAQSSVKSEVIELKASWPSCSVLGKDVSLVLRIDKAARLSATGTILASLLPEPLPLVASRSFGPSLRILTYNVQMLPSFVSAGTDPENARRIAKRIRSSGYDFVVLNEVFDEDARDAFREVLPTAYPYHVDYLSGGTIANEDAGLMFWSRFPIVPLAKEDYRVVKLVPNPAPPPALINVGTGSCTGTDCDKVAFLEFDACDGDDCWAEKGVGFVRVRNPETHTIYNVAFTHLQASYAPFNYPEKLDDLDDAQDEYVAREAQLADIERVIKGSLFDFQLGQEPLFVLGDMNVDGDLSDPILSFDELNRENLFEWYEEFGPGGGFFWSDMREGWAYENAGRIASGNYDRGLTNVSAWGAGTDGARLDYILRNMSKQLCSQHMTLAHNLRWSPPGGPSVETGLGPHGVGQGGLQDLSDHYGVDMDVNVDATACSPVKAEVVTPYLGHFDVLDGTLGQPGQIHWYRFDKEGTYSFAISGAGGPELRVYQASDMTTPAAPYKEEITDALVTDPATGKQIHFVGTEFRAAKPPFYVRVYHPDRSATGSYSLQYLLHDCSTPETACALAAGQRRDFVLGATPPLNGRDEAWFELTTEAMPSGSPQSLGFFAGSIAAASGVFTLELYREEAGSPVLVDSSDTLEPDPAAPGEQRLRLHGSDAARTKYYLRLKRAPSSVPPYPASEREFQVSWETNLTILFGAAQGGESLSIRCLEENDPLFDDGDDEIYLESLSVDATQVVGLTYLGDFDSGNARDLEHVIPSPLYFVSAIEVRGFEDDDFLHGESDPMAGMVWPLAAGVSEPVKSHIDLYPIDGGLYRLYFNLTHGFDR